MIQNRLATAVKLQKSIFQNLHKEKNNDRFFLLKKAKFLVFLVSLIKH